MKGEHYNSIIRYSEARHDLTGVILTCEEETYSLLVKVNKIGVLALSVTDLYIILSSVRKLGGAPKSTNILIIIVTIILTWQFHIVQNL